MKKEKIEALQIISVIIDELEGSDCTDSSKVKKEIRKIALSFRRRYERLKNNT